MVDMKAPWMRIAQTLKGEAEIPGAVANPKIVEMFKIAGCPDTPEFRSDETAWCAAFVNSCLRLSGYAGTNSALASSFSHFGVDLGRVPQAGCVTLFWPLAGTSSGHVGFFVGDDPDHIQVLGGNQSDQVKISTFPKTKWRSYRWPSETAPVPEEHSLPTILTLAPDEAPDHARAPGITPTPGPVIKPVPANNFARLQPIIDKWEGGFTDDPQDPGGATNMGITQADLKRWRQRDVTKEDVRSLTHDEAMQIFKAFYWDPLRCDEMPIAAALVSYNAGVNSGLGRGARWLQQSLNKQGLNLDVDGSVGPLTLSACTQADMTRLVNDFAAAQEGFLRSLPTFSHFGTGWMNRMNDVKARALAMANESVVLPKGPVPTELPTSALQSILEILKEKAMASTALPLQPPPSPGTPSPADLTTILQQVANVLQKINLAPNATPPAPGQQQQQQAAQLQKIFEFIASILNPGGQPQALGQVNGAFGDTLGNLLNGKKTAIGILGTLLTAWLSNVPQTAGGTGLVSVLSMIASSVPGLSGFTMPLFLALSAWGVLGKLEKWAQGTAPPPQPSK